MSHLTAGPETFPPRDPDHSVRLNVSLSSGGAGIADLSRHMLANCFDGTARKATEKHLNTLLANLYEAWVEDPTLALALSMTNSGYKAKSRYNPSKVSNQLIGVVNRLADLGYLYGTQGFNDRRSGIGRTSRVWPSAHLAHLLGQAQSHGATCVLHPETEVLILRDQDSKKLEYDETPATLAMRSDLRAYNRLLEKTFIDVPELQRPIIPMSARGALRVSQRDKLVRRVFNRSSWEKGGRFYGGWWQNCPKLWRERIFMNDQPTIEEDYSGLHIIMLYAWKGIDYWRTAGLEDDPYRLDLVPHFVSDPTTCRAYAKTLLLMAINANSDKGAFKAFRSEMQDRGEVAASRYTDAQLTVLLDALKAKHSPIAEYLGAGAGIDLMFQDGQITQKIIRQFVVANRPILTIHDSYIVMFGDDERLRDVLKNAFAEVTGIATTKLKRTGIGYREAIEGHRGLVSSQHRSEGYLERLAAFHSS